MDDVQMTAAVEGLAATTAYLFGRKTFEKMAAFWPCQPDDNPMAAHLNATPKYVAPAFWANQRGTTLTCCPAT